MRHRSVLPHLVSFHPAHSGGRLSCDLNVKAKFVSSHHGDGVLVAGAAGVQVYFGRVCRERKRSVGLEAQHVLKGDSKSG